MQVDSQATKARQTLGTLWGFSRAKAKTKVHVIKTLVFPHLTYPCVPLHTATNSQLSPLQCVQNDAIRFAMGVRRLDYVSAKDLHERFRFKFQSLNQTLYWRAKKLWENISAGTAADPGQFALLKEELEPEPDENYHKYFPSSLDKVNGPEPKPMYSYQAKTREKNKKAKTRPVAEATRRRTPAIGRGGVRGYLRRGRPPRRGTSRRGRTSV